MSVKFEFLGCDTCGVAVGYQCFGVHAASIFRVNCMASQPKRPRWSRIALNVPREFWDILYKLDWQVSGFTSHHCM